MQCRRGSRSIDARAFTLSNPTGATPMLRNAILWFAGVPIVVIMLLNILGFLS
jgi:heme/copper-type cytochrome/quinol oxidase subunit 1